MPKEGDIDLLSDAFSGMLIRDETSILTVVLRIFFPCVLTGGVGVGAGRGAEWAIWGTWKIREIVCVSLDYIKKVPTESIYSNCESERLFMINVFLFPILAFHPFLYNNYFTNTSRELKRKKIPALLSKKKKSPVSKSQFLIKDF